MEFIKLLMSFAGCQSQAIAILAKLFDDMKYVLNYRLGVVVQSSGGAVCVAYIELLVNTPPTGGTCSVTPTSGTSAQTMFFCNCSGWTDPNGIQQYQLNSE